MKSLHHICEIVSDKISVNELNNANLASTYISTENMLPNKGGVVAPSSVPTTGKVTAYKTDDVLVSNIRPYFKKIWFATNGGGCSNDVLVFRAKKDIFPEYLHYVLADDSFFDYAMKTSKGTKMPRGDKKALMEYEIVKMDYSSQCQAATILKRIDDLIKTNTKINENLEQQAQAVFKSWFVDFEPFGGVVPDEMQLVPLQDLCEVVTKGTTPTTLGKSFSNQGINFIKAESILNNHSLDRGRFAYIDEETNSLLKRSIIKEGDIVFTIAGTLGRFALVDDTVLPANTNQAVAIIRANKTKLLPEYLYSFFLGNWHNDYYKKRVQQAVQANLSLTTIKSLPIAMLSNETTDNYNRLIIPIIQTMKTNEYENQHLGALRDTLLPKLMSGEIDVSEVKI